MTALRLAFLCALGIAAPVSAQVPMPGGLDAGPFGAGFRVMSLSDPSRPGPRSGTTSLPDRARRIDVHVWYPAASAQPSGAMTMKDYLGVSDPPGRPGAFGPEHRQLLPRILGMSLQDADWARYQDVRFTAVRDAAPANGRFPLLVGMLRPISVVAMGEYLASHGYVVAFVRSPLDALAADGLTLEALMMAEQVRDMQMAIAALRGQPFVDPASLGALGFSGDGLAQLVLAMRFDDVEAVSQLETGYFGPVGTSSYQEVTAYDPAALRAPMLFAYSENLGRNTDLQIAEIEKMRYAPRYLLYLGEPRMSHWDFATEGAVLASVMNKRPEASRGVLRAFGAIQRYQRTFFDAFVKKDAAARARLSQAPASETGGALIEVTERPAVVPAMTRREFQSQIDADLAQALRTAREGLKRDPLAAVFDADWLNGVGYEALQRSQREKAVAIFELNAEAHPSSANAHDSLSEALEAAGRRADALQAAEKALALLPSDTSIPQAQRKTIEAGLRARVARLR